MAVDRRFLEGLRLFNGGDYFECHEVIEDLWLETPSEDVYRDLYKGVIQAAAAIYQFDRGILSGARGLFRTASGYLKAYEPEALGLNVAKLRRELERCFQELEEWDGREEIRRRKVFAPVLEYKEAIG